MTQEFAKFRSVKNNTSSKRPSHVCSFPAPPLPATCTRISACAKELPQRYKLILKIHHAFLLKKDLYSCTTGGNIAASGPGYRRTRAEISPGRGGDISADRLKNRCRFLLTARMKLCTFTPAKLQSPNWIVYGTDKKQRVHKLPARRPDVHPAGTHLYRRTAPPGLGHGRRILPPHPANRHPLEGRGRSVPTAPPGHAPRRARHLPRSGHQPVRTSHQRLCPHRRRQALGAILHQPRPRTTTAASSPPTPHRSRAPWWAAS